MTDGELPPGHAAVVTAGTQDLPGHLAAEAEPVLVEAAGRLDPPRLRRVIAHLQLVADPDGAEAKAERRQQRRACGRPRTLDAMVAVDGLLDSEAGQTLVAALARPADAQDQRSRGQPRADASPNWPAGPWRQASSPRPAGSGPAEVTVDLDSLLGHPGDPGRRHRHRIFGTGGVSPAGL